METITLLSGHVMALDTYVDKMDFLANVLKEQPDLRIIDTQKVNLKYDYSFLVRNFVDFTKEQLEKFGRQSIKPVVLRLTRTSHIIGFVYI